MQAILRAYHADTPVGDSAFLRVLPIGDSITWGSHSSDRNGYRNTLHNLLTKRGNSVDFVGSVPSGTMEDNQHEGHRGETISQISASSSEGIHAGVNLVLLHAGTNDANLGIDIEHAAQRLKKLMEKIWKYNPTAVILVCQIIPSSTHEIQERIELFNSLIPGVVQTFIAAKKRVVMVKMNEAVDVADLDDNLHPKDEGYVKMANTWFDAINEADSKGWITAPGDPTEGGDEGEVCETTPTWSLPHLLAEGAKVAKSDGDFIPKWNTRITAGEASCKRANLRFFDLDGDGVKDFACLDSDSSEVSVHLNRLTDGHVPDKGDLEFEVAKGGIGRPASGVLFADLNGDGRDDFIYVNPDGEVDAWINLGKDSSDSGWAWKSIGQIAGGVGATEKNLQMADINGDGRADFLLVDPDSGEVTGWLNKGAEIMPDYHKLGIIASGRTTVKDDVVFMGDFTGEGRADYMVVSKDGKVSGYTNRLQEDTALIPRWLERLTLIDVSGLASVPQAGVRMVDLNGDGKVDFVWINSDGDINVWENAGEGGKYQPGEGVFICDLDGDGIGDYFWVDENGHGWGYLNVGHGDNLWHDLGNTAIGTHIREDLRMAVLTKTGRADYVLIDEFSGRADWWQNLGVGQDWGWESRGVAATGPRKTFEAEYGGKFTGKNVRFADLDGDGFDDYLYLSPRGSVVMWRNLQTNPISWGLPKLVANKAEAVVPSNIRFADINGDGLLDYIVVDPVSGGGRMWANLGVQGDGSIRWNTPEVIASGASTGPGYAIQIADMTGDGRADYMSINPDNGRVDLWINTCSG
ncbi:hypothetical protein BJ875DRAFT_415175 [Amylocarpus encephaloides]|uniref:SGNH hydrolase-type esterase domain-containing protein n=1 Tax=Amylocarpus encephaloides TaxID=45428 RepID=A0A9P7YT82_9HELO|nr:hypothetical protein BJ875DRAFT_415175 [Amylocarpus encephaloides]